MERTPKRAEIFKRLSNLSNYDIFNKAFNIENSITKIFGTLDCFVHTRGREFSSSGLNKSNFIQFSESSFKFYSELLFHVIHDLLVLMIYKYPIGIQPIQISEKFGLNGPIGGFLEEYQVNIICSIISREEQQFLKDISDEDPFVRKIVNHFEDLPDISEEDFESQMIDMDKERIQQIGYQEWLNEQKRLLGNELTKKGYKKEQLEYLEKWAIENGYG